MENKGVHTLLVLEREIKRKRAGAAHEEREADNKKKNRG